MRFEIGNYYYGALGSFPFSQTRWSAQAAALRETPLGPPLLFLFEATPNLASSASVRNQGLGKRRCPLVAKRHSFDPIAQVPKTACSRTRYRPGPSAARDLPTLNTGATSLVGPATKHEEHKTDFAPDRAGALRL